MNNREMLSKESIKREKEKIQKLKDYLNGALFCLRDVEFIDEYKLTPSKSQSFKDGIKDVQNGFLLKRVLKKWW